MGTKDERSGIRAKREGRPTHFLLGHRRAISRIATAGFRAAVAGITLALVTATPSTSSAHLALSPVAATAPVTSANPSLTPEQTLAPSLAPGAKVPSCGRAVRILAKFTVDDSQIGQGTVVIGGISFDFGSGKWTAYDTSNATVSQAFHSDAWLVSYAQAHPQQAVDVLLQQARQSPDPGSGQPGVSLPDTGWSESQVTKRMWSTLCVWDLTHDQRLLPIMDSLAVANMDPHRYYGPPYHPPHNHGLLANEILRVAGRELGRQEWVSVADERDAVMLQAAFDTCGMVFEQSSTYQAVNMRLWEQNTGSVAGSAPWKATLARARSALGALANPDGTVPSIGDGSNDALGPKELSALGVTPGGSLFCPNSGWAATTQPFPGGVQHLVAHFGPQTKFHGHPDHMSAVWFVQHSGQNIPVLVDHGLPGKQRDAELSFARSPAGHSVLEPVGVDLGSASTEATLVTSPDAYQVHMTASTGDGTLTRDLAMADSAPVLAVNDEAHVPGASAYVQHWQLAPSWSPGNSHTAWDPATGETLDVVCLVDGFLVTPTMVPVSHFPATGTTVPSWDAQCKAPASANGARIQSMLIVGSAAVHSASVGGQLSVATDAGTFGWTQGGQFTSS